MHLHQPLKLGLRENMEQFCLLVVVNAFVGSMVGLEQAVVPLIGQEEFGIVSKTAILSFIASFGAVKACCNLIAGGLSESLGRKKVLLVGWLFGLPVPLLIMWAPSWSWVVFANLLLGVNQGLAWSMTVNMKIDLVGPVKRGLAMGLNEFAGYVSVSMASLAAGYIAGAWALRPYPFYLGVVLTFIGFMLSLIFVRETREHALLESRLRIQDTRLDDRAVAHNPSSLALREVFALTSWRNRALFACSQAGLANNLQFGVAWGLHPLFFATKGLGVAAIGIIKAIHPGVWGLLQLLTGPLSDRFGRKWLIAGGLWVQAAGVWVTVFSEGFGSWILGSVLMGIGAAMLYPTLLAAVGDVANPQWRATSIGVYRFWRDMGYAVGAVLSGVLADIFGIHFSIYIVGWFVFVSGVIVAVLMYETHQHSRPER